MQLKFTRQKSLKESIVNRLVKLVIIVGLFILAAFLLEKVDFSKPTKDFNTDITNEIIRLK
jgi:flagellar biogenesis protein FliO|tara:strand:+ start:414 stop:596 length:183 start_codon:yes stop_codon:yes gene_type:complete